MPGLKLNLGSGSHPLPGYVNLDKKNGWTWESGLQAYEDNSVYCVTSSHSLMYVAPRHWPLICSEVFRVLKPLGVWRITEDETEDPRSIHYGGFPSKGDPVLAQTSVRICREFLEHVGFSVFEMPATKTHHTDDSILQDWYLPTITTSFWVEGIKPCHAK